MLIALLVASISSHLCADRNCLILHESFLSIIALPLLSRRQCDAVRFATSIIALFYAKGMVVVLVGLPLG